MAGFGWVVIISSNRHTKAVSQMARHWMICLMALMDEEGCPSSCTVGACWDSVEQLTEQDFSSSNPGLLFLELCGYAHPSSPQWFLDGCFPNVSIHLHQGILLKCRFRFSRSGWG